MIKYVQFPKFNVKVHELIEKYLKKSAKYFQHTFHLSLVTVWVDRQPACKH